MTNATSYKWNPAEHSILLDVDSYKGSHFLQYPPGTEYMSSYIAVSYTHLTLPTKA